MARQRRLNEPGSYHHITARGVDRCPVFIDDVDRRQFLALLRESHRRFGCRVLAFCLMDNHIHLTVQDDRGTLSKTLHFLNGVYAKKFNLRHDRTGHLFERRFWSSMLDSDAYLTTCVKYVHRNPLEAGMVDRIEQYRWSSYPSYIGERRSPTFLDTSVLLRHYGDDVAHLRTATEECTTDSLVLRQLASINPPHILGADARVTRIPPEGRSPSAPRVSLECIVAACAGATNVSVDEVLRSTPGRRNEARSLAAFVAHRHAGHTLADVAEVMNLNSCAAASLVCRRFSDRLDPASEPLVRHVLRSLNLHVPTC